MTLTISEYDEIKASHERQIKALTGDYSAQVSLRLLKREFDDLEFRDIRLPCRHYYVWNSTENYPNSLFAKLPNFPGHEAAPIGCLTKVKHDVAWGRASAHEIVWFKYLELDTFVLLPLVVMPLVVFTPQRLYEFGHLMQRAYRKAGVA